MCVCVCKYNLLLYLLLFMTFILFPYNVLLSRISSLCLSTEAKTCHQHAEILGTQDDSGILRMLMQDNNVFQVGKKIYS